MTDTIGFVGLGQMGKWIALNMIKAGYDVTVYDLNPDLMNLLAENGARTGESPASVASGLVFLCLPDGGIIEQVLFGPDGLVEKMADGSMIIDLGTTNYLYTLELGERLEREKIIFADSPITGMEKRAREADLTLMFGGPEEMLSQVKPILNAVGSRIVHTGPLGSGQLTKLINQLLFNANMAALAEILPLAVKLGLDPEKTARVVNSGTGRSFASEFFIPNILDNVFNQGYPLAKAHKDMVSGANITERHKIDAPVFRAAGRTYQEALDQGLGAEDKGAMIKVFEKILNVSFRRKTGGGDSRRQ